MRTTLVVMPSVPVVPRGDGLFMDVKMVEGLVLYASLWGGPVRCLARAGHATTIAYGRDYAPGDLPFETAIIADDAADIGPWLDDAAIVLAAGDNYRDLPIASISAAPVVFIIEYTLSTRLKIVALDLGRSMRAVKSAVWTLLTERKRRRAFRASAGLQANGQPAFAAYRRLAPTAICYFDSRMSDDQQISDDDLSAKQAQMLDGQPLRLAFSGRLEPMKGADHLIPVAVALNQRGVAFTLDIFGEGSLRPAMAQAVAKAGLTDRVRLRGSLAFDTELVPTLKSSIDLFLCCHRQDDPSCTYLETLSCGVPIVGYDNGAFAGVLALGPIGMSTPMNDTRAAASAIAALDGDRERLAAMAASAAAVGRAHSFEKTFAARIDHLRRVAAARGG